MDNEKNNQLWMENDKIAAQRVAQAQVLKAQVKTGGLKFETYLPPAVALWVLEQVEQGVFIDPAEAIFVLMQQAHDIDPHDDLKLAILKKRIEHGMDSAKNGQTYSAEEVAARMERLKKQRTPPAVWQKIIVE